MCRSPAWLCPPATPRLCVWYFLEREVNVKPQVWCLSLAWLGWGLAQRSEQVLGFVGHKNGDTEVQGGLQSTSKADQGGCPMPRTLPSLASGWHQDLRYRTRYSEAGSSAESQPQGQGASGLTDTQPHPCYSACPWEPSWWRGTSLGGPPAGFWRSELGLPGKCRSSLSGEGTGGRTAGPSGIRTVPSKVGSSSSAPTQMRPLSHTHHSSSPVCAARLGYIPVLEPEQGGGGLMLPETSQSSILMQRCSQSQRAFGLEVQGTNHPLPRKGEMSSGT